MPIESIEIMKISNPEKTIFEEPVIENEDCAITTDATEWFNSQIAFHESLHEVYDVNILKSMLKRIYEESSSKYYMTSPTAILNNKTITARSTKFESVDEIISFIKSNDVIPYGVSYYKSMCPETYQVETIYVFRHGKIDE